MDPLAWETTRMEKSVRTLQVESHGYLDLAHGRPLIPRLRLKGQWLARAGFPPGTRATVCVVKPGCIVLRAATSIQP
jgi:hypothetical protein